MTTGQAGAGMRGNVVLATGRNGPPAPVPFRVLSDGQPPAAAHGADADGQGLGTLAEQRMYQLIRQPGTVSDRTFEIAFLEPGAEACSFTFG